MSCKFYVEYEYYLENSGFEDGPEVGSKLINTTTSSLQAADFAFIIREIAIKENIREQNVCITSITKIFEN